MAPYQFKRELGVVTEKFEERIPNAVEREKMHGFKPGHTKGFDEGRRISFIGNSFSVVAVSFLLISWAMLTGFLVARPRIDVLWEKVLMDAGRPGELVVMESREKVRDSRSWNQSQPVDYGLGDGRGGKAPKEMPRDLAVSIEEQLTYDPGDHRCQEGQIDNITTIEPTIVREDPEEGETIIHLVQDEDVVNDLHDCAVPPDEYYDELFKKWQEWWPNCSEGLLEHISQSWWPLTLRQLLP